MRLLKAHSLMLREVRRRVPEALTLPQFDVLAQLQRRPEGMTPRELTRELLVPGDRRAIRIRLSGRGREVIEHAIPRHRREVERLLAHVRTTDLKRLRELLSTLNRGLEVQP